MLSTSLFTLGLNSHACAWTSTGLDVHKLSSTDNMQSY